MVRRKCKMSSCTFSCDRVFEADAVSGFDLAISSLNLESSASAIFDTCPAEFRRWPSRGPAALTLSQDRPGR